MLTVSSEFDSQRRRRRSVRRLERALWKKFKATPTMLDHAAKIEWLRLDDEVPLTQLGVPRLNWLARGGYLEASSLLESETMMPHNTIGFHLVESTQKVRSKGLDWFGNCVLRTVPQEFAHEIDRRVKAGLVDRYGAEEASRGLYEARPYHSAFFGRIRLTEWLEPGEEYWHLEGRLDFGGVPL